MRFVVEGVTVTSFFGRRFFRADLRSPDPVTQEREQVRYEDANLVSSEITPGVHAPVLDIDFPARLVPSTTEGHFHLYLDKPISWETYVALLVALRDASIIEPGFCDLSIQRGASFLRLPHVQKQPGEERTY